VPRWQRNIFIVVCVVVGLLAVINVVAVHPFTHKLPHAGIAVLAAVGVVVITRRARDRSG
jgi:hypothetical protein